MSMQLTAPAVAIVGGLGLYILYTKYEEQHMFAKLNKPTTKPIIKPTGTSSALGLGLRPIQEPGFRSNPYYTDPVYRPLERGDYPGYRERIIYDRKLMHAQHPTGFNDLRENNNWLTYAGGSGLQSSRLFLESARRQSRMTSRRHRL